jgi:release factor glutamine methyltransferase
VAELRNLTDPDLDQRAIGMAPRSRLGDCLVRGYEGLRDTSDSPQLDAELLLAFVLGQARAHLRAHPEQMLERQTVVHFLQLLDRRAKGEPVAYLTGEREFWSLRLHVTPDVLIPRPETELAVERCLALAPRDDCAAADLGTGSGAIALALASERPRWRICACDRSEAALRIARDNAARLNLTQVEFLSGEWLSPLQGRQFDLIVSNPPYIAAGDPALAHLHFEPTVALTPASTGRGSTGLEDLCHILLAARSQLVSGGWLVLEHGSTQGAEVARALVTAGYARVRCHPDLAGHDRVTEAQWP